MRNKPIIILLFLPLFAYLATASCSGGQYTLNGFCYRCPKGFHCPDGTTQPVRCKLGEYSDFGSATCTPCPAGFKCVNQGSIPIPCEFGQYSEERSTVCTNCQPGFHCPNPHTRTPCNTAGKYCLGGKTGERPCPAGYMCPTTANSPIECPEGTYSEADATSCTDCPAGKYCISPSFTPRDCPTGYYSLGKATSCTKCPANHICPAGKNTSPQSCPIGEYAPPMASSCTICPAGYKCNPSPTPNTDEWKPVKCVPTTHYSGEGSTECLPCPSGSACPFGKRVECAAGYYYDSSSTPSRCSLCPAGKACPGGTANPVECAAGSYSTHGQEKCTICTKGKYCPVKALGFEIPCPKMTFQALDGQESCVKCNGGINCNADGKNTEPTYCEDGQYHDGLYACHNCPAGYYCPDPRTSKVIQCPKGYYASAKSSKCLICPAGSYCIDGTSAQNCPDGYFSIHGQVRCTICPPGYACLTSLKTILGVIRCPPGHIVKADRTSCEICSEGKMCPFPEFGEIDCPDGTYAPSKGMSFCMPCPHGHSCSNKAAVSTPCGDGKYSYLYEGVCKDCPINHACIHGLKIDCPLNYFSTASSSECSPCENGKTCMYQASPTSCASGEYSTTATFLCRKCPPGYSCTGGTATGCAAGKYAPHEGLTSCTDCPDGTYSPAGSALCYVCPPGHGCAAKTGYARCPPGRYAPAGSLNCINGIPGFVYPPFSEDIYPAPHIAPRGTYSKLYGGTGQVVLYKCPAGKYSAKLGATEETDCIDCPKGFYCPEGTGDPMLYVCPQGYYCGLNTVFPTPCPENTYSYVRGSATVESCRPCAAGYSCPGGDAAPEACPMGSFCPFEEKQECPEGYYSGTRTGLRTLDECVLCPTGHYCPKGTKEAEPAPKGHYNPWMGMSKPESMLKCPPSYPCPDAGMSIYKGPPCQLGHYCPAGTVNPNDKPCPKGTYSNSHYAISEYDCLPCPRGYACKEGSSQADLIQCESGYFCPRGTKTTEISSVETSKTYPCPAGTYRETTKARRLEDCLPCPHGKFCVEATITPVDCPAGYYCPRGTKFDKEFPCKAGTYDETGRLKSPGECVQCGFGKHCKGEGQTSPTACADGYYNNFSMEAAECIKCPAGYKCDTVGGTINPILCEKGQYSDVGATSCTDCEVGYFCPEKGITKQSKLTSYRCYEGMYCESSSKGLNVYPTYDSHGCQIGHYCPEGTTVPIKCPAGTYNPVKARGSLTDCLPTVAGYYTLEGAGSYTTTLCKEGYYCREGSPSETQYPCPPGTYRGIKGAASPRECVTCPSGHYCLTATAVPANCPVGFYCPLGTSVPESCPEGTYSDVTNLFDSKSCKPCPPGRFCYQRNLTASAGEIPVDKCDPGFYCIGGSRRPEPRDKITGDLCPKGGYCPEGAATVAPCPAGKYMIIEGASQESQCVPCPPGYYCEGSNSPEPTGKCHPGYYCDFGETGPEPNKAEKGYYAPLGSQFQLKCPRGTYAPAEGQRICDECDPGYDCTSVGLDEKTSCSAGYYCPSLTWFNSNSRSYDKLPCPPGRFNSGTGRSSAGGCDLCPLGKYCPYPGMSTDGGSCAAGFYCLEGSPFERPPEDVPTKYGPCPEGKFCLSGVAPTNCPTGTYSNSKWLKQESECLTCYEGKYCGTSGITQPTGDCSPGFYCGEGETIPNVSTKQCKQPKYCPPGSGGEINCPPGFYQDTDGQGFCKECPSGSYCHSGTIYSCIPGHYCP